MRLRKKPIYYAQGSNAVPKPKFGGFTEDQAYYYEAQPGSVDEEGNPMMTEEQEQEMGEYLYDRRASSGLRSTQPAHSGEMYADPQSSSYIASSEFRPRAGAFWTEENGGKEYYQPAEYVRTYVKPRMFGDGTKQIQYLKNVGTGKTGKIVTRGEGGAYGNTSFVPDRQRKQRARWIPSALANRQMGRLR